MSEDPVEVMDEVMTVMQELAGYVEANSVAMRQAFLERDWKQRIELVIDYDMHMVTEMYTALVSLVHVVGLLVIPPDE